MDILLLSLFNPNKTPMKQFLLSLAFILVIFLPLSAQKIAESEVPSSVVKMYHMKMTDTVTTSWEKYDNFYTARFTKSNLKASMVFSENAEWIWTRWEIPSQYLPKKVSEHLVATYPKYKITGTTIEYKPGGEYYLVKLKKKKEKKTLRYSIKTDFVGEEPDVSAQKK